MKSKIALRASCRLENEPPHSTLSVWKKLSATALSQQLPLRLMLATNPSSERVAWYSVPAYWQPRSEWCTRPAGGFREVTAIRRAANVRPWSILSLIDQPMARLEKRSKTTARYSHPSLVERYVMSVTHARFGASWRKRRSRTLGAMGSWCRDCVVRRYLRQTRAAIRASRINLATRCRPTTTPSDTS